MLVNNLIVSFVLCAIRTVICYDEPLDEGDSCQQLGLGGICRRYDDCPVAIHSVRKKGRHNLRVCGFAGLQEVVCCPGESPSDRHPTLETSTIDNLTVWIGGNTIQSNSKEKNKTNNDGRIKGKRRAEIMCEKFLKENNVTVEIDYHVLNGEDAAEGQFPHMAALGVEDDVGKIKWACGASLIAPRFLLTAAHCIICSGCGPIVKVRLGVVDHNHPNSAQDVDVKQVIQQAEYNIISKHNDIALVELVQDVKMSKNVYPACLYTRSDNPIGLLVSGWGETKPYGTKSSKLQFARLEPVEVQSCNTTMLKKNGFTSVKVILNTQICAKSTQNDACQGDSGGPLQIERKTGGYDIVGIVSYGTECSVGEAPGIYTRVSAYLDWIEDNVWP